MGRMLIGSGAISGMRRVLVGGVLGAFALLLVPAAGWSTHSGQNATRLTKVTVALIPVDPAAQPMYAKDRGFFKNHELDVTIAKFKTGDLVGAALASGQAQFSVTPVGLLAQRMAVGAPIRGVAAGSIYRPGSPTTLLVAAPGKRITRARDLVGKKVLIDFKGSPAHLLLLRWLERNGVPFAVANEQVKPVEYAFEDSIGPLKRGQVDAAVLPEPWATRAIRQAGAKRIALPGDAVCSQDCLLTALVARKDVPADVVARFRLAIQDAAVWANKERNHAASRRILARYAGVPPSSLARMERIRYATRWRLKMAQPWLDAYIRYGLVPNTFTVQDLVK
jgi:NitT/TauT family transport system substrate-binding protein